MSEKYILIQDNDCHWYVIPVSKKVDWFNWCESDNYGYEDLPKWAVEVGGSPCLVEFETYKIK